MWQKEHIRQLPVTSLTTIFERHGTNRSLRTSKTSTLSNETVSELLVKNITASPIASGSSFESWPCWVFGVLFDRPVFDHAPAQRAQRLVAHGDAPA